MKFIPSKEVDLAIKNYLKAKEKLKQLNILRSDRNLAGEYAEWILLNAKNPKLTLAENTVQKGFDAYDDNQKTYQIKSRQVKTLQSNTSFDIKDINNPFDFLICVFFDKNLDVLDILIIPRELVLNQKKDLDTNSFRFRWTKSSYEKYCHYSIIGEFH